MKPRLSIIIVSYNVRSYLERCLRSIQEHVRATSYEVIVVDNHSQDDSVRIVRKQFPKVRIIENHQNQGFAKATNQGVLASTGDFVLLLNPDTLIVDDALDRMLSFAERQKNLGALGCKILNDDLTLQSSCRNFPNLKITLFEQLGLHKLGGGGIQNYLLTWDHGSVREVDSVKGACMLVPKAVFDQIGLLDERFFLYGEEMDFCKRLAENDLTTWFFPDASIIHFGEKSSEVNSLASLIELHKAQGFYFRKHFNGFSVAVYKLITLLGLLFRMSLLLILIEGDLETRTKRHKKYNLFKNVLLWYFNNNLLSTK